MSLINDALKRASQADRQRAPTPPPAVAPAAFVPTAVSAQPSGRTRLVLPLIMVALAGVAAFFFLRALRSGRPTPNPSGAVAPQAVPATAPIPPAPAPVVAVPPSPAPAPAPIVAPPAPAPAAVRPPTPPPPAFPTLKLQAILYSKDNPVALINGQTAAPGDVIAGARVKSISAANVSVEWNGQTRTLLIGAP